MSALAERFREHFELAPARSPAEKTEIYRLRYAVYSEEIGLPGFEAWRFPDGLEHDEYDHRAVHYAMRHRPSGKLAGTVRLILADPDRPEAPFPIEAIAGHAFDPALFDPARLPRPTTAEISRLIIASEFRVRGQDRPSASGTLDAVFTDRIGRRQFPHPMLGLLVAIVRMSAGYGITHWYAGMEPSLERVLNRFCLRLNPIGPIVQYHGERRPYIGAVDDVLAGPYHGQRDLWDLLTDCGTYWPPPHANERTSTGR